MIDRLVLIRRVEEIEKHLAKIEPFAKRTLKDFLGDPIAQDVVEYNLFQIVNHLIDMVQHIAVDEDYGYPQTAYEAGHLLLEKGVFAKGDQEIFGKMVGFRNVVGHDYLRINSTGAKKISENSLSPLCLKGHNDFFDGHRTSPPVPFGPPTLTLPLGGGREGWG